MSKPIKPYRLITIGRCTYQSRPREKGCNGCDLNNLLTCPMIVDRRFEEPKYDCFHYGVILKRVQ